MTPIIYNLIFGWYRSTSGRHRPFPSDFGHLRPFYSLQNRRIFLRFVGERRQARGERESLLPCATRTSSSPVSQVTRKRPKTDASERKRTISSWSGLLVLLASENPVCSTTEPSGFWYWRSFSDGTQGFQTLASLLERYWPVSDIGFQTFWSDFKKWVRFRNDILWFQTLIEVDTRQKWKW